MVQNRRSRLTAGSCSVGRRDRCLGYPFVQLRIDQRVIEQVEMVEPAQHEPVFGLERDPSRSAATGCAVRAHQVIPDEQPDDPRCGGGRDEVVADAGKERYLTTAIAHEFVRIAFAPVLVDARPKPQVLDSRAARIKESGDAACFG